MSRDRTSSIDGEDELARIRLSANQRSELLDFEHFLICNLGGFGSGKTFLDVLIWLQRAGFDTAQRHGFFANTEQQAIEGIFPELEEILDKANIEWVFGTRPPRHFIRQWEEWGIEVPNRGPRSLATLILENGIHVVFFGLANQKYKRAKGYQFGSAIVEEITELESPWVIDRFIIPRIRCGLGPIGCHAAGHRHQLYLRGNPPQPEHPHWIRQWIRAKLAEEDERRARGEPPFFRYIRSSTRDNLRNLGAGYLDTLLASMDAVTAAALVDGELTEALIARTYHGFTEKNKAPVPYDPHKPLFVALDFNVEPAVATLGQELDSSDVPKQYRKLGTVYQGTFGMIFEPRGLDAGQLMTALIEGKLGTWPDNFKGLKEHQSRVIMYGDATGGMRRVEAVDRGSAWKWVHNLGYENLGKRYTPMIPKSNPTTFERVGVFNALANPAKGVPRYFVHPEYCKPLIRDFENVVPPADGSEAIEKVARRSSKEKAKENDKSLLTHASDAETYKIHARYGESLKPQILRSLRSLPEQTTIKPLSKTPWE